MKSPVHLTFDSAKGGGSSTTRGRPPPQGERLLERPRLISLISRAAGVRLVQIQAPAGYGKTSLLQQWAAQAHADGALVAWLSVDERDGEPMTFVRRVLQSLEESGQAKPQEAAAYQVMQGYLGWRAIVQELCDSFVDAQRPCYLLIDDAQCLKNTDALACLRMLLVEAPPDLRMIVSSREDVGVPLARMRALGELLEISAEDLRFLDDETQAFLEHRGSARLSSEQVHLLQERAEGWIAGIKLFSMALNLQPENSQLLQALTGERRQVADFFLEDVFSRQPRAVQDFLLRTSVFDRFCTVMCNVALGIEASQRLIDEVEDAGLFLVPLDQTRTWYRYHHLFAEFLRRQLRDQSPGEPAELCRRAAEWLTSADMHVEAFDCALKAQDPVYAAEILDAHCESIFAAGMQVEVQAMAARIPSHILALYPRLLLIISWRLIAQWRLPEARSLVGVAGSRLREMESVGAGAGELERLRFLAAHRESQIAHAVYDLPRLEETCAKAIQTSAELSADPYLLGSFCNSLQFAQREQYKLAKVDRLDAMAREQVERTGAKHGEIFIAAISGPSYMLMGKTERAETVMRAGLRIADQCAGRDDPLGSVVALSLAELHYERNEIAEAEALVRHYMPLATSAGFVDQLLAGWTTQARLQVLRGDVDAAFQTLEAAAEFGARHDLERLHIAANAQQIRLLLQLGRAKEAAGLANREGLLSHRAASVERGQHRFTTLDSAVALAACRLMAAEDRVSDALSIARSWRSFVTAAQAVRAAVDWDVLLAELLLVTGERLAAQRALSQALPKAATARLIRPILDEGEPIAGLIRQMGRTERPPEAQAERFLSELAACLEPGGAMADPCEEREDIAVLGKMSERETKILALAGAGAGNRQIGEQLGLTEGTVKWYLQQIFDKVGVRDRKQAVARARRLGLIA